MEGTECDVVIPWLETAVETASITTGDAACNVSIDANEGDLITADVHGTDLTVRVIERDGDRLCVTGDEAWRWINVSQVKEIKELASKAVTDVAMEVPSEIWLLENGILLREHGGAGPGSGNRGYGGRYSYQVAHPTKQIVYEFDVNFEYNDFGRCLHCSYSTPKVHVGMKFSKPDPPLKPTIVDR